MAGNGGLCPSMRERRIPESTKSCLMAGGQGGAPPAPLQGVMKEPRRLRSPEGPKRSLDRARRLSEEQDPAPAARGEQRKQG